MTGVSGDRGGGWRAAAAGVLAMLAVLGGSAAAASDNVTLFAAASTASAMDEVAALFAARGLGRVRASYAASSVLAKQIANGAPADVFVSANADWMDYLDRQGAIESASRIDLLGNALVLIAPAGESPALDADLHKALAGGMDGGWLAMGDPDHVPAGLYGKAALLRLGLWPALAARIARAQDARGALALVARGEAAAGVVYATDALISDGVRVVAVFPTDSHPRITYPAALVAGDAGDARDRGRRFLDFLGSAAAAAVFRRHGFRVLSPGSS